MTGSLPSSGAVLYSESVALRLKSTLDSLECVGIVDSALSSHNLPNLRGSPPRSVIKLPSSANLPSSFALISYTPSCSILAASYRSNSWPRDILCSRRDTFSDRRWETSDSRLRMRRDCIELTRAISRFCRTNLRLTKFQLETHPWNHMVRRRGRTLNLRASRDSVGALDSFSRAMLRRRLQASVWLFVSNWEKEGGKFSMHNLDSWSPVEYYQKQI